MYEQAAAYGVVSQLQAQSARAAAEGRRERKFDGIEKNSYAGVDRPSFFIYYP